MSQDRIVRLNQFIMEDPKDPFPKYALAIEYLMIDKSKSIEMFEDLIQNHPDYVATYYHAAAAYAENDMRDRAEWIYKKGIERAEANSETHALKELKSAYLNFQFEE